MHVLGGMVLVDSLTLYPWWVRSSFAVVIQELPNPLRDAICVFYLVLRALDTVEDDMAIPVKTKLPDLYAFHEKIYDR
jgi:farnesyl-diphosphate farnesyltransferase